MNEKTKAKKWFNSRLTIAIGLLATSVVLGQNCTGSFKGGGLGSIASVTSDSTSGSGSGSGSLPSSGGTIATPPPSSGPLDCNGLHARGASKSGIRRLNKTELVNTLQSNLNWSIGELYTAIDAYSDLTDMTEVSSFSQTYSQEQMAQWAKITDIIASTFSNPPANWNVRKEYGGDCFAADPITAGCWSHFFTTFGKRIYRHPLSPEDIIFLQSAIAGLSTTDAVYRAVTLMFRSPDFLFHLETGVSEDENRVRLSAYEVANRISYSLTAKPPDATLLAAADADQLNTTAQIEAQARRIVGTKDAQTRLQRFFANWLQYDRFATPDFAITSLATSITWDNYALNNDANDYINDIFWGHPGTFNDLMTSSRVFPRTESLRIAYGVSGADQSGQTRYDSPDHPGLLTRIPFLSEQGSYSSPIKRGVFIKRRILCDYMPTPDFSVVAQRLDQLGSLNGFDHSNSEMVTLRTNAAACISCHSQINPIGFSLEQYDVFGKSRKQEAFVDWATMYDSPRVPYYQEISGRESATYHGALHPLPYPVAGVSLGPLQTMTVNSPSDLTTAIGASARARTCMVNFVLRDYERRLENSGDTCAINEVADALGQGAPVSDVFIKMLATEDIFWRGK